MRAGNNAYQDYSECEDHYTYYTAVIDNPAGSAYVVEWTDDDPPANLSGNTYVTRSEADADVTEYYNSIRCWAVFENGPNGYCWYGEYTDGTYQDMGGGDTHLGSYDTEVAAKAAVLRATMRINSTLWQSTAAPIR